MLARFGRRLSSSEDDSSSSSEGVADHTRFGLYRMGEIPRTSGKVQQFSDHSSDEMEEEKHDDFPVSQFFENEKSQPYEQFVKRQNSGAAPLRGDATVEFVEVPEQSDGSGVTLWNPVVQMLEIQYVIPALGRPERCVHTWCDIMAVPNVEAKRVIGSFFKSRYQNVDKGMQTARVDVRWGETSEKDKQMVVTGAQAQPKTIGIYHYIGVGYPPPEPNRIWVRDPSFADSGWRSLKDMVGVFSPPCFLVFDCDRAAILRDFLTRLHDKYMNSMCQSRSFFAVFACAQNEVLRLPSHLPQNFFSCVLLSPEQCFAAVTGVNIDEKDTSTFVTLMDIIAESVALDVLPVNVFHKLFRGDAGIASLWRRFLLAQRLMKRFGLHVQSIPTIADMSEHRLWTQLEYAAMRMGQCNMVNELCRLYLRQFDKVKTPAKYVRSFVATILSFERAAVLPKLAEFMMQSPTNCNLMAMVISPKSLGDYNAASRNPYFRSWCAVVSGLALASPTIGKTIMGNSTQTPTSYITTQSNEELTRVLLASTVVCLKDSQTLMVYYCDPKTTNRLLPLLFTSSPLVREWISLLLHASIARFSVAPGLIGPSGLHAYAMLLLFDTRKYTRAVGVAILTSIMAPGYPEFNSTVMQCAMKAAIDGHRMVRLAYIYCVARYANLNKDDCTDDREYTMDFYLRKDILQYAKDEVTARPALKQSILMLSHDADSEIRDIATAILQCPTESRYFSGFQGYGTDIHRAAHASLFSRSQPHPNLIPRYDEHLFYSDELEHFETRSLHNSKVTVLAFDPTHSDITCGYEDGTIIWGDNTWNINSSVVALAHLPKRALAVASSTGEIHMLSCGWAHAIEVFRPSITPPKAPTIIKLIPGTAKAFIAQGNNEIIIWDLEALLAIDHIVTSSPPVHFVVLGSKLLCALTLGSIIQVDIDTHKIERQYEAHAGHRIMKMGESSGHLYTVIDNGQLYRWDTLDYPQSTACEAGFTDFCIHRLYPSAVKVTARAAFFIPPEGDPVPLPANDKLPVCCCFDDARPMCAIGYSDGCYSVWRIPKSLVSKPTFS